MSISESPSDDAPLMMSVSGVRGIVGRSMTAEVARRFAAAFGSIVAEKARRDSPLVLIGRDSRPSGQELMRAVSEGLFASGCRVIDLGIVMTPTVAVMVRHRGASGGIVITASHNPIDWNGLKFLNEDGAAPAREAAEAPPLNRVDRNIECVETASRFSGGATDQTPSPDRDESGPQTHVDRVLDCIDVDSIVAGGFKVVLDSVNGAGGAAGRDLLQRLGCNVVHLNGEPMGQFAHPPEPLKENLTELTAVVRREDADVGFAQDPDGDRLAIVDEEGRYIGEEYTLALCARRVLERDAEAPTEKRRGGAAVPDARAGRPLPPLPPILVTNLSTSRMIDDIGSQFQNVRVVRTPVGEANVVAGMKSSSEGQAILGGEGNGGVIWPPVCPVRDSLSAMALVLELLASRAGVPNREEVRLGSPVPVPGISRPPIPLSAIVNQLPRYEMIKRKIDLSQIGGRDAIPAILDRVKHAFANEEISDADGVRIDFPDGWVHLRPSNTEPILRLIAEARTTERSQSLIGAVGRVIQSITRSAGTTNEDD